MTIHSLYIFDRHCICVYYQDWHRTRKPKHANEGGLLPGVSRAVMAPTDPARGSDVSTARNTLSSSSGVVIAVNETPNTPGLPQLLMQPPAPPPPPANAQPTTGLAFDEEGKLVYGVVLSLRNMVKKVSGRDEQFIGYKTSTYKLHLFETLSGYKFVLLTDPGADSQRLVLRAIYAGPFLEYVVRNPLMTMDSRERGVDNHNFRLSVDRLVQGLSTFY